MKLKKSHKFYYNNKNALDFTAKQIMNSNVEYIISNSYLIKDTSFDNKTDVVKVNRFGLMLFFENIQRHLSQFLSKKLFLQFSF